MTILPVDLVRSTSHEEGYLSLLDVDTLLSLSLVTLTAQKTLNNEYFQRRFQKRHPRLANSHFAFQILKTFHPNTCMKVACWILAGPHRQISNFNFLMEASLQLPHIKASMDQRLLELNGSYIQEASERTKAWIHNEPDRAIAKEFERLQLHAEQLSKEKMGTALTNIPNLPQEQQLNLVTALQGYVSFMTQMLANATQELSVDFVREKLMQFPGYQLCSNME